MRVCVANIMMTGASIGCALPTPSFASPPVSGADAMRDSAKPWLLLPAKSLSTPAKARALPAFLTTLNVGICKRSCSGTCLEIRCRISRFAADGGGQRWRRHIISCSRDGRASAAYCGARGLNDAVDEGREVTPVGARCRRNFGPARRLPLAGVTDLREFVSHGSRQSVVLCRDRRSAGTNGILLPARRG